MAQSYFDFLLKNKQTNKNLYIFQTTTTNHRKAFGVRHQLHSSSSFLQSISVIWIDLKLPRMTLNSHPLASIPQVLGLPTGTTTARICGAGNRAQGGSVPARQALYYLSYTLVPSCIIFLLLPILK